MADELHNPNSITRYSQCPVGVVKAESERGQNRDIQKAAQVKIQNSKSKSPNIQRHSLQISDS